MSPQNIALATEVGKFVFVAVVLLHMAPIMAWVERRGSAVMQNRSGPNRVGPLGLLISLCDALKFLWKEDKAPGHVDKFYYTLAPLVSVIPAFMTFAVIPFASSITIPGAGTVNFQLANLDVGLLYILSISSLGVYGIIMAGWSSNNKYALLGSLRSSSQMISYELALGFSLVGALLVYNSVKLPEIVAQQSQTLVQLGPIAIQKWGILLQPVGFIIFLTSIFAETNRLPFDLPEGESELVAGYHLEYGSMKFAIFMMAEMINMFVGSALCVTLFFGGYHGLGWVPQALGLTGTAFDVVRVACEIGAFLFKCAFFMWLFVWVRWTLPRFRYDQLMDLGWKVLLPLAIANVVVTAGLIGFGVL